MKTRKLAAAAVAATVALTAAACGDDDGSEAGGNGTDRAFALAMIPHHQSAVEMAKIAQDRGRSAFVKQLADDIVRTQTSEIETLRNEDEGLDTAGVEKGTLGMSEHAMGMSDDPAMLRDAKPFDEAFLKMMIPHHRGAVAMARAELAKGEDPQLRALAQDIIDAQQREITEMRDELGMSGGGAMHDGA
ncbi:MAG TPA: DUF305 domain-containing protein, partial [Casimicrobiaceae bacterium]